MTTSAVDDDDPRNDIAVLTTLGKTKKTAALFSKSGIKNKEGHQQKSPSGDFKFIAVNDATETIDLNISLHPTNDPEASHQVFQGTETNGVEHERPVNVLPDSILSPAPHNASLYDTPKRSQIRKYTTLIPDNSTLKEDENQNPKPKDYSLRSSMITERIKFEIFLEDIDEVDIRTKALVIFGKIINIDPSRKILAYHEDDELQYPLLEKHQDLPSRIDDMSKYISAPMLNSKSKKLQFYTRFRSVTSLLEMKRDQEFMVWLKNHKIFTSVMNLNTTENTRAGFFLGKAPHLTNLTVFTKWVIKRVTDNTGSCPEFQVNVEVIGRYKDPSTRCRAIVVTCSRKDADNLKTTLDSVFHSRSNFPFTPFRVMNTLDARTQNALYHTHKARIQGSEIIEICVPDFHDLDTPTGKNHISLRDMCFDMTNLQGTNMFVDVDNATRSGETVFHVRKTDKLEAIKSIETLIKSRFFIQIKWNNDQEYDAKTYRLDPKSRSLASQLAAIAHEHTQPPPIKLPTGKSKKSPSPIQPAINAWIDLTKVKEPPEKSQHQIPEKMTTDDDATITTLSESTWFSATLSKQEATEKFKKIGHNIRNLSYRHKKLEAGQECLEMEVGIKMNQLFRCFELHHHRLERLEAARDRQAEIQLKHIQITLDPLAAKRNGTLASLERMLNNERRQAVEDRKALEEDRVKAMEGPHEEDSEFLEKQAMAGRLFDRFHRKLEEHKGEDDSSFNVDRLSDAGSEDSTMMTDTAAERDERDEEASNNYNQEDSAMDTTESTIINHHGTNRKDPPFAGKVAHEQANPPNKIPEIAPTTWDSEEDESHQSPPLPQPPWTTTPTRQGRAPARKDTTLRKEGSRSLDSTKGARRLFQKMRSPKESSNRFSPLGESISTKTDGLGSCTRGTIDSDLQRDEPDQSHDSDYSEEDSADDSLDAMSLVSGSEIQGLEDDLRDFDDDDGYDTETTDNTSPRHKRQKSNKRKSSERAKAYIIGLKESNENNKTKHPISALPHPSPDTTLKSDGHGAAVT